MFKVLNKFRSSSLINRSFFSISEVQPRTFPNVVELESFLKSQRPSLTIFYFRAKWNPMCDKADVEFEKFANKISGVEFIKLDTDLDERFKKYFAVKNAPEFIITCLGSEMIRHVGLDMSILEEKLNRVTDFYKSCEFIGKTGNYEDFRDQWKEEYNTELKEQDWWLR